MDVQWNWPGCCEASRKVIRWMAGNDCDGPDVDGWAMNVNDVGDPAWANVSFCPFCGAPVQPEKCSKVLIVYACGTQQCLRSGECRGGTSCRQTKE
jgi:hypothetical protein